MLLCTRGWSQLLLLLDQVSNNWNLSLERKERAPDVVGFRWQPKAGKVVQTQQLWLRKEPSGVRGTGGPTGLVSPGPEHGVGGGGSCTEAQL